MKDVFYIAVFVAALMLMGGTIGYVSYWYFNR